MLGPLAGPRRRAALSCLGAFQRWTGARATDSGMQRRHGVRAHTASGSLPAAEHLLAPHRVWTPQRGMPQMLQARAYGCALLTNSCAQHGRSEPATAAGPQSPPSTEHTMPLTRSGCAAGCAKQAGRAGGSGSSKGEARRAGGGGGRSKGRSRCPKHDSALPLRATAPSRRQKR